MGVIMEEARKILKVGDSFYISIPAWFVKKNHLKKGDRLVLKMGRKKFVVELMEAKKGLKNDSL